MLASCLPFFLQWTPYFLLFSKNWQLNPSKQVTVCVSTQGAKALGLFFKYSFLCFNSWLLDIGCYESTLTTTAATSQQTQILWNLYSYQNTKILTLTLNSKNTSFSLESLFRNARWLEREASEMSGWFFLGKKDRRTLFLIPVFFSTPLKKSFPTGGFFELLLCPLTSKLTYKHVSWLS